MTEPERGRLADNPRVRLAIVAALLASLGGALMFFALFALHESGKVGDLQKAKQSQETNNARQKQRIDQLTRTLRQHHVPVPAAAPAGTSTVEPGPGPAPAPQPGTNPSPGGSPPASPPPASPPPASPSPLVRVCVKGVGCKTVAATSARLHVGLVRLM